MSLGRIIGWALVASLICVPLNWVRLWIQNELSKNASTSDFLIGTIVCWALAAGIAYFLTRRHRALKLHGEQEEDFRRRLLAQPLEEIRPNTAIINPGEKAYAAVLANLMEVQTVGYSANTSGVSLRLAKGVTFRTGGMRGRAAKGLVNAASGELVITESRVLFSGDRKSFDIPLIKLLNATHYSDGFRFSDAKKTYMLTTENNADRLEFAVVLEKVLHPKRTDDTDIPSEATDVLSSGKLL